MNGAESLVRTLLANQVNTCFANPGTSEMHFVAALDRIPGMKCVLGLQENVVTGMADGYWRMLDRPAATLLHCGPGLANGLGNLHNARIARSGIVNVVGDQATYHRPYDPPLAADTEGWARPVSAWVRTSSTAACVGADAAAAVQAARSAPGWIATLVLPADTAWNEGGITADPLPVPDPPTPDPHVVRAAARVLREESGVLLLLGGRALRAGALLAAHRLRAATGCRLLGESFNARVERGQGRVGVERVPYNVDLAVEALRDVRHLILVQAAAPVGFFAYPGKPSLHYPEDAQVHVLARPEQDALAALEALCDVLGAPAVTPPDPGARPEVGRGAPSPEGLARTVGALLPENAVVVDEIISYSYGARARLLRRDARGRAPRLAADHGRGDRLRPAARHRCGDRGTRAEGGQPAGGRLGHVHLAGAMDPGAGATAGDHGCARQPEIRHSPGRVPQRGGQPRAHGFGHDGPGQPGPELGEPSPRHGGGGRTGGDTGAAR